MEIAGRIEDREVLAALERLQSKGARLRPIMAEIGAFYERRVVENFQRQADPEGRPWQPLSQTTMMLGLARHKGWRPKRGGLSARGKRYLQGKRILWEHGDLEGAVHSQANNESVRIGVGGHIPYAAIHQFGGKAGRGRKVNIPARAYLAINRGGEMVLAERDRQRILEIAREHLDGY